MARTRNTRAASTVRASTVNTADTSAVHLDPPHARMAVLSPTLGEKREWASTPKRATAVITPVLTSRAPEADLAGQVREPGPSLFGESGGLFLDPDTRTLLHRDAQGLMPTRLILQDYWLFRDETLHFAQGRLHLSGHNGSGKSTALVAAVTLLLDGDTSPARLDPFGSRQRTMRYYLLGGEDKGFHLRTRRAFLALEFRTPDGTYQTIGLALTLSEGGELKKTGFWLPGQVNAPGGVSLREHGLPISEARLREAVNGHTPPGELSSGQKEHADLVRRRLYGHQTSAALFTDTLSLLTTLRGSKLGGDVKPSTVEALLRGSLPPLDEGVRTDLAAGIDKIDRHLQVQAKQERQLHAADVLAATDLGAAQAALDLQWQVEVSANTAQAQAQETLGGLQEEHRQTALEAGQTREQQEAAAEELERTRAQRGNVQLIYADQAGALQNLRNAFERARSEHDRNQSAQGAARQTQTRDQQKKTAREGELAGHQTQAQTAREALDALPWYAADDSLPGRQEQLRSAGRALKQFTQDTLLLNSQETRAAQVTAREQQAQTVLAARNAELEEELRRGAAELGNLAAKLVTADGPLLDEELQEQYRGELQQEPDLATALALIEPAIQAARAHVQEQEDAARETLRAAASQAALARNALETLRGSEEPPLVITADRQQVMALLHGAGIPAAPFYRAVRPAPDQALLTGLGSIESALQDAQLLGALVVRLADQERALALLTGAGLADALLLPGQALHPGDALSGLLVPEESAPDSVSAILASINRHTQGVTGVSPDGRWNNGPLHGQALPRTEVRFLGQAARDAERTRTLNLLRTDLGLRETQETQLKVAWEAQRQARTEQDTQVASLRNQGPRQRRRTQAAQASADARSNQRLLAGQAEEALNDLRALRNASQDALRTLEQVFVPLGPWTPAPDSDLQHSAQSALDTWSTEVQAAGQHESTWRQKADVTQALRTQIQEIDERLSSVQSTLETLSGEQRRLAGERDTARSALKTLEEQSGPGTTDLRRELERLNDAEGKLARRMESTLKTLATLTERQRQQELQLPRLEEALAQARNLAEDGRARRVTLQERHPVLATQGEEALNARQASRSPAALQDAARQTAEALQQAFITHRGALETPDSYQPVLSSGVPVFGLNGLRASAEDLRAHLEDELLQTRALLSRDEAATFQGELIRNLVADLYAKQRAASEWVRRVQGTLKNIRFNGERLSLEQDRRDVTGSVSDSLGRLVDTQQDPHFAPDEWLDAVGGEVRQIIEALRAQPGADLSFAQAFEQALDYRQWTVLRFVSVIEQGDAPRRREITDRNFAERSGGERSAVLYSYLFAAVAARFDQLGPHVPRLIGLDEAFAGMDTGNIGALYRIMTELDLSWVLTSQHAVHLNPALPAAAAYEFFRVSGKTGDSLSRLGSLWNGVTQRRLGA